jgi:uncharacterized protein (TIGR03086 family)
VRFRGSLLDALDLQVEVIEALGPGDLATPSMCAGWTVRDVLEHSVGITTKFTEFAAGRTHSPHAGNVVLVAEGDAARAAARARDTARAAWPAADPGRSCTLPFGVFTAELAAGINLVDVLAHTWDVAAARDLALPASVDLWADALEAAAEVVPDAGGLHYAAPMPVADSAPAMARFLARVGRRPTS